MADGFRVDSTALRHAQPHRQAAAVFVLVESVGPHAALVARALARHRSASALRRAGHRPAWHPRPIRAQAARGEPGFVRSKRVLIYRRAALAANRKTVRGYGCDVLESIACRQKPKHPFGFAAPAPAPRLRNARVRALAADPRRSCAARPHQARFLIHGSALRIAPPSRQIGSDRSTAEAIK
jgi:hypothetical protein